MRQQTAPIPATNEQVFVAFLNSFFLKSKLHLKKLTLNKSSDCSSLFPQLERYKFIIGLHQNKTRKLILKLFKKIDLRTMFTNSQHIVSFYVLKKTI